MSQLTSPQPDPLKPPSELVPSQHERYVQIATRLLETGVPASMVRERAAKQMEEEWGRETRVEGMLF